LAGNQLAGLPIELTIISIESRAEARLKYISQLGAQSVVAIGNGRNDRMMLKTAALGIAVVQ
jgi:soluble P-type ATPase